jgi:hypothetical protein
MRKTSRRWLAPAACMVFAAFLCPTDKAFSFSNCARIGDPMEVVAANCGEPSWVESEEKRYLGQFFIPPQPSDGWLRQSPFMWNVALDVEIWVYNYGPSRLLRVLKFDKGILRSIFNRGYGI